MRDPPTFRHAFAVEGQAARAEYNGQIQAMRTGVFPSPGPQDFGTSGLQDFGTVSFLSRAALIAASPRKQTSTAPPVTAGEPQRKALDRKRSIEREF